MEGSTGNEEENATEEESGSSQHNRTFRSRFEQDPVIHPSALLFILAIPGLILGLNQPFNLVGVIDMSKLYLTIGQAVVLILFVFQFRWYSNLKGYSSFTGVYIGLNVVFSWGILSAVDTSSFFSYRYDGIVQAVTAFVFLVSLALGIAAIWSLPDRSK